MTTSQNLYQVVETISLQMAEELSQNTTQLLQRSQNIEHNQKIDLNKLTRHLPEEDQLRVLSEFHSYGPLECYLNDDQITEIMICDKDSIWIEKNGELKKINDGFLSQLTYNNFIQRLFIEANAQTDLATPYANGNWQGFRLHICSPPITKNHVITLRKLKNRPISLSTLMQNHWCTEDQLRILKQIVIDKKNIVVVGNTGSGKTTLLNALVAEAPNERCLFIEDTSELLVNNSLSIKLLTRTDGHGILPDIDQTQLLKQTLRMRPDRLIIGEIRGQEAKDLLQALATGHRGSMASLHAHTANESLLRLEMLIQMGAPQWSLDAIRRLIQLTLDYIVITRKEKNNWYLEGIYKISTLETFGFTVEKISDSTN